MITICHTDGCPNNGVEIVNEPSDTVICGACGVEITDKTN